MIDEVIGSVLEAEARAEEISANALREAASIAAQAEERVAAILADAEKSAKAYAEKTAAEYKKKAAEAFEAKVNEGKREALAFSAPTEGVAEDIVRCILSDC